MNEQPAGASEPNPDEHLSELGRAMMGSGSVPGSGRPAPWVPPSPEELQALLPQYQILSMLGRGGMGAVYMGRQLSLDRPVAIKILSGALEDQDLGFKERFKNEARAMARLNHPGIVSVYDSGETSDGLLFIVMEYVDGTDVARMIASEGRLHTEHAMAITAHVCDALAYAHSEGIIHRDIKPANIMVGYNGAVKVADFGLAKVHSPEGNSLGLTMSGMAMGTMHYIAPEALLDGPPVDHRADLYAVGVMLYQMLTGRLPQGMFTMPSLQVPGLDPRYDAIIARAMMQEPGERYQGAQEFRAALDHILTQPVEKAEPAQGAAPARVPLLPSEVRPKRPGIRQMDQFPSRSLPKSASSKPRPRTWPWVVGGVVVLGVAAYLLINWNQAILETPPSMAGTFVPAVPEISPAKAPPSDDAKAESQLQNVPKVEESAAITTAPPFPAEEGWIPLFNGVDLSGWEPQPSDLPARVEGGTIRLDGASSIPASGNLYYRGESASLPEWTDYEVVAAVKTENLGNSGIFLHSRPGNPDRNRAEGVEVQILNNPSLGLTAKHPGWRSGGLQRLADSGIPMADGEWFQVKARVEGKKVTTWMKRPEESVWTVGASWTQPENWNAFPDRPEIQLGKGTVSLQNNPPVDGVVWFKDLYFRSLTPAAAPVVTSVPSGGASASARVDASEWKHLFNRETLVGWQAEPANMPVSVVDGMILIRGVDTRENAGFLFFTGAGNLNSGVPEWTDFEALVTLKTSKMGNSGLKIHTLPPLASAGGIEVNLWNEGMTYPVDREHRTGSAFGIAPVAVSHFKDEEWFTIRILVEGKRLRTWLQKEGATDWIPAVDWTQPDNWESLEQKNQSRRLSSGTIAFTNWVPAEGDVWIKEVKVKLPAPSGGLGPAESSATSAVQTFNGNRYQFIPGSQSWSEAKARAESLGGHLATITSKEENDWLVGTFGRLLPVANRNIWLGAIEETPASGWRWITGEPFSPIGWVESEPNGVKGGGGQVGHPFMLNLYSFRTQVGWNDSSTHFSQERDNVGFIVEWDNAAGNAPANSPPPTDAPTTIQNTWTDTKNRTIDAEFIRLEGDKVVLNIRGTETPVLLSTLSPESQEQARRLAASAAPASRYSLVTESTTWAAARAKAIGMGGDLAMIESQAEQDYLVNRFGGGLSNEQGYWIGGSQSDLTAPWRWSDGSPIQTFLWHPGEPNNAKATFPGQNVPPFHLALYRGQTYGWNDLSESDTRWSTVIKGFLVEWEGADAAANPTSASPSSEDGFIDLFSDEEKAHWVQVGQGKMEIRDGVATNTAPSEWGVSIYAKRSFSNFTFKAEFKGVNSVFNSGIWLRIAELSDDIKKIALSRYEVGICNFTGDLARSTGAIWRTQPARVNALKVNDWNEIEVTVIGQRYLVKLNGVTVNDFTGNKGWSGYIGLEENGESTGGPVQFRNVRVKPLP